MLIEAFVLLVASLAAYLIHLYIEYQRVRESVKDILTFVTFLGNDATLASVFSSSTRFVFGQFNFWLRKHDLYERHGWDISAAISLWPHVQVTYTLADPKALKEIGGKRTKFPKPLDQYKPLEVFGKNILVSEGDLWKKYRKITSPAFSERNSQLVWNESVNMLMEFFDEVWKHEEEVSVDNFVGTCLQFGLRVISAAGFGKRMSWNDNHSVPEGHELSFKETFQTVSQGVFVKLLTPDWFPNLTERIRKVRLAFDELQLYMQEVIQQKSAGFAEIEKANLFSNLIEANDNVDGSETVKLDDSELMSNIFIFLLAGHETSSHTLSFAFGLLALHQDEQEKLCQHIISICPDRLPNYADMPALTRSLAVIYETLRLLPPVVGVPKQSNEDTTIVVSNEEGQTKSVPVPKGTNVIFHATGVHYNPRYWKDPHEFLPERFLGDWSRDAFVPFSVGARSCLGRRFSEIESVAILTVLIKHYKVSVTEEPRFKHETFHQRKDRVLKAVFGITHTPVRIPLTFTKRK
ncbi:cytochrome P450 [Marasmius fiardii PR-910]|nr:cytochrome P450 [Marasmius fiardii PR-910]